MTQQHPQPGATAPSAAPEPVRAPAATAALLPANAIKRAGGYEITIQGVSAGVTPSKSRAVALLCEQAIARKQPLIATFIEGSGRTYLSVSARGEVTRTTGPAPGTTLPSLDAPSASNDLGTSRQSDDSTRAWVEETLLVKQEAAVQRRRGILGLGRRR